MSDTKERKTAHIGKFDEFLERQAKKPIRFQIETTDTDFFLALVKWLDKYPAVKEGSTVLRFLGDKEEVCPAKL